LYKNKHFGETANTTILECDNDTTIYLFKGQNECVNHLNWFNWFMESGLIFTFAPIGAKV